MVLFISTNKYIIPHSIVLQYYINLQYKKYNHF